MNVDDVTERLREVGPHVRFRHLESASPDAPGTLAWFITEHPAGPSRRGTGIAIADDAVLAALDWDAAIAEGKERYEASATNQPDIS